MIKTIQVKLDVWCELNKLKGELTVRDSSKQIKFNDVVEYLLKCEKESKDVKRQFFHTKPCVAPISNDRDYYKEDCLGKEGDDVLVDKMIDKDGELLSEDTKKRFVKELKCDE